MKNLIKIILFSAALLVVNVGFAQKANTQNAEKAINQQMEKIQSLLNIDDLQSVVLKNTLVKYAKQRMSVMQTSDNSEIIRAEMGDIKIKESEALSKILDKEQIKKLKKYQKSLISQRRVDLSNNMERRRH